MFLLSSCSCLCPVHWNHVLSHEWRCSWSSADRRCSNCIGMIYKFIAYKGVPYIGGLTVSLTGRHNRHHVNCLVQDCSISNALAMEILQYCSKPPICSSGNSQESFLYPFTPVGQFNINMLSYHYMDFYYKMRQSGDHLGVIMVILLLVRQWLYI